MKILQVIHFAPLREAGGSESYTGQLSQALSADHDIRLFFTIPDEAATMTVKQGRLNGLHYWGLGKKFFNFDRPFHERSRWVEREFAKAVDAFKPDIIHFQQLINLSLGLPRIAKERGIACCFTLHDFWLLCPRNFLLDQRLQLCPGYDAQRCTACLSDRTGYYATHSAPGVSLRRCRQMVKRGLNRAKQKLLYFSLAAWRPWFTKRIFQDIDLFIAPSRFLREKYIGAGVPSEKIVFCRHGFETEIFRGCTKTSSPALRFAFIGALRPHKGIDTLIAAFNTIPAPHELKIYGAVTPSLRHDLQKKITNPRIHVMGVLKREDKKSVFSSIDVLIMPSLCYENCPLVIGEAFMTKTPVIVSDLGGMAELVETGVAGLTFAAGDSGALAEKIMLFINDATLKERFAAHIPAVKDMAVHADEITGLYRTLVGPGSRESGNQAAIGIGASTKQGASL